MRLLLILEEKWKRELNDKQGVEGITYKLTRQEPYKETRYKKIPARAYNFETLMSELNARDIIGMINKAFRAYGYKTDLLPLSALFKYSIKYIPGDDTLKVSITTSAFNKTQNSVSEKKQDLLRLIGTKALMLNFLIMHNDMHKENFVKKEDSTQHYAIDFGMAFTQGGMRGYSVTMGDLNQARQLAVEDKDKLERYANYINFWSMFLEHNANNMIAIFDKNRGIVKRQIYDSGAPEKMIDDTIRGMENYTSKITANFKERVAQLKTFVNVTERYLSRLKK